MNSIFWRPKALRQLRKVDSRANKRIRSAVTNELSDLGTARNVTALVNHDYGYRLRVESHRVFFNFDGAVHIVYIEEIRKRNERTY